MSNQYKVGDKVWVIGKQWAGKIVAVDHNNMYYIDLDTLYDGQEVVRTTTYSSDLKAINTFHVGDRVYCKNRNQYGVVDRASANNVGVILDGQLHSVYMSHPVDLLHAFENKVELIKPEIKVGTRIRVVDSHNCGIVTSRDHDSIIVLMDKNNKKYSTSVFLVDKTKKQPSKSSIQTKDPRYMVLATWIKDSQRVYRVISVQQLVFMIRKRKTDGLRARMIKSGVVYPGTETPSEEDNTNFVKLMEKHDASR